MAEMRTWFKNARKIWFIGAALALVLLWSIENPYFYCHPALQLFLREFSFALLIACIFGMTIEEIQRSEFIRLVTEERQILKRDVFLYAYGSNLPDDIRQEIRGTILEQSFYRQSLVVDWEFTPIADNAELMTVMKRYSYSVVNNSNDPRDWMFTFVQIGADDLKAITDSKLVRLRVTRGQDGSPNTKEYAEHNMKTESSPDQPHTKRLSLPIRMDSQETIGIYYEVRHVRRTYGDDRYHSKEPVIGISKIRLRFPKNFEVQVACKTRPLRPAADNDPPTRYSLEWPEGMLPFTGMTISWSKKEMRTEVDPQPSVRADAG
jgi:hypothetical protein